MTMRHQSHINIRMSSELRKGIKDHCNEKEEKMAAWVRGAIIDKMNQEGNSNFSNEDAKSWVNQP